ncbi:MAG: alpha/beta hydrolase [Acidobacteria bacterium]|nr:MAG: alpha/beta hydrolase [Acidobacteriota bacterium]REJ99478.1 MAG: alpha/beta hydrolase [Acidobacteriota bacterium]
MELCRRATVISHVSKSSLVSALALVAALAGCATVKDVGLRPLYVESDLDGTFEVRLDVAYRSDPEAHPQKHRLDLFLPHRAGFPLLAFVHGGSFENGDKGVSLAGLDIYGNIGRFYAARGVGVALINYRLQPEVHWPSQVDDVARAVAWLARHQEELGGDGRLFLSGHSAGAWLVSRVALDRDLLERPGVDLAGVAGVISVSGSGFDMTDEQTWEMLGGPFSEAEWAERFDPGREWDAEGWKSAASIVPLVRPEAPPFLIVCTSRELEALQRQNRLFHRALGEAGVPSHFEVVGTDSHRRMALAMSHPDRLLPQLVLDFVSGGAAELAAAWSARAEPGDEGRAALARATRGDRFEPDPFEPDDLVGPPAAAAGSRWLSEQSYGALDGPVGGDQADGVDWQPPHEER